MKHPIPGALAATCLAALLALAGAAGAADHRDSPLLKQTANKPGDITDIYAFRSPTNAANLVAVLNTNPRLPGESRSQYFSGDVQYILHVVAPGGNVDIATTFTGSGAGQTFTMKGLPVGDIVGTVGQTKSQGGVTVFCGPRDDPFFFDLDAFKHFLSGPYVPTAGLRRTGDPGLSATPTDFFAGSDVASIVIEFPAAALPGITSATRGVIKAWASTRVATSAGSAKAFLTGPIH